MLGTSQFLPAFEKEQNLDPTQRIFHDLCNIPLEIRQSGTVHALKVQRVNEEGGEKHILMYTAPVKDDPFFTWVLRLFKSGDYGIQNQATGLYLKNPDEKNPYKASIEIEGEQIFLSGFDTNQIYKEIFSNIYANGPRPDYAEIDQEHLLGKAMEPNPDMMRKLKCNELKFSGQNDIWFYDDPQETPSNQQDKPLIIFKKSRCAEIKTSKNFSNYLVDKARKEIGTHVKSLFKTLLSRNKIEIKGEIRPIIEFSEIFDFKDSFKSLGNYEVKEDSCENQVINALARDVSESCQEQKDVSKSNERTGQNNNALNDNQFHGYNQDLTKSFQNSHNRQNSRGSKNTTTQDHTQQNSNQRVDETSKEKGETTSNSTINTNSSSQTNTKTETHNTKGEVGFNGFGIQASVSHGEATDKSLTEQQGSTNEKQKSTAESNSERNLQSSTDSNMDTRQEGKQESFEQNSLNAENSEEHQGQSQGEQTHNFKARTRENNLCQREQQNSTHLQTSQIVLTHPAQTDSYVKQFYSKVYETTQHLYDLSFRGTIEAQGTFNCPTGFCSVDGFLNTGFYTNQISIQISDFLKAFPVNEFLYSDQQMANTCHFICQTLQTLESSKSVKEYYEVPLEIIRAQQTSLDLITEGGNEDDKDEGHKI